MSTNGEPMEFFINFNLCSINERDAIAKIKGVHRKVLSAKYRQCKAALISEFSNHKPIDRVKGPYKLTIQSYQYADYDNYLKIIGDSLEKAGVIANDRDIVKTNIIKYPIKRGGDQEHYIRIENYEHGQK